MVKPAHSLPLTIIKQSYIRIYAKRAGLILLFFIRVCNIKMLWNYN